MIYYLPEVGSAVRYHASTPRSRCARELRWVVDKEELNLDTTLLAHVAGWDAQRVSDDIGVCRLC